MSQQPNPPPPTDYSKAIGAGQIGSIGASLSIIVIAVLVEGFKINVSAELAAAISSVCSVACSILGAYLKPPKQA